MTISSAAATSPHPPANPHHVVLHQLGWTLTAHPDGTSQITSPDGKIIRSYSPPPRPGNSPDRVRGRLFTKRNRHRAA